MLHYNTLNYTSVQYTTQCSFIADTTQCSFIADSATVTVHNLMQYGKNFHINNVFQKNFFSSSSFWFVYNFPSLNSPHFWKKQKETWFLCWTLENILDYRELFSLKYHPELRKFGKFATNKIRGWNCSLN